MTLLKLGDQPMPQLDSLVAQPPPPQKDPDGVFRVGKTRVTFDTVLHAFHDGCTPEQILQKYPSLGLTDIYAVITYYLWHRDEVDHYLQERRELSQKVRREMETRFPPQGIRERLMARRESP
jgi:uncharacterized protein (DUF433 family)